jgi:uncharacterized protein (TIGR00251 family)
MSAGDASAGILRPSATGVVLTIRVVPRSSSSGISGVRGGALLVRLHAPPVEGAANAELVEVLADALGVAKKAVVILDGERGRDKRVAVTGVDLETALRRLGLTRAG